MTAMGEKLTPRPELIAWLRNCQRPGGGFTYSPDATLGAVEDAGYTWAGLSALHLLGARPAQPAKAIEFLARLRAPAGLWRETVDGRPNPLGSWYSLESLAILGHVPPATIAGARLKKAVRIPADYRVWTMQIEAPGKGSPEEAATIAAAAGVHIWAAKNTADGWLEAAQEAADRRQIRVRFERGSEEYGTFVRIPGIGTYSHLVDLCAPAKADIGVPMPAKVPHQWPKFRDQRIPALRQPGGRLLWQFNENEELTRMLLDEAVEKGTYAALCTFHFGNENFLHSQPFLHRFYGRLPFVALQDAHHAESWWGQEQVVGFRTLFVAKEPTWDGWLTALDRDWVMGVRRDEVTSGVLRHAGGLPEVRAFVNRRSADWQWWSEESPWTRRPLASLVTLHPRQLFEAGTPDSGVALRIRLAARHTPQGQPREPLAELIGLSIDGRPVQTELVETKGAQGAVIDRYCICKLALPAGLHTALARVRDLRTNAERTIEHRWEERA